MKTRPKENTREFWQFLAIISGIFFVVEGILSLIYSQDQRLLSDIGRYIRIIIGGATIIVDGWFLIRT